jgi:putative FmdB family regulatory protein
MPFYEYECENCKFYTELLQKISDPPLKKCPSCGKNQMKKLVSAPVFRLKGAGWYETDFKSDKENKRNLAVEKEETTSSADKSAEKPAETKSEEAKPIESKTDSKSEAATAPKGSSGSRLPSKSKSSKAARGGSRSSRSSSAKRSKAKRSRR